jgi:hypothetical protein
VAWDSPETALLQHSRRADVRHGDTGIERARCHVAEEQTERPGRDASTPDAATQGVAGGVASVEVWDGAGVVAVTDGVEVPETVVLGVWLGVGVVDVLVGLGVAVLL